MGYSEIECRICGVSFNISRFRTDREPRSAAWANTGDYTHPHVICHEEHLFEECGPGCYYVVRQEPDCPPPISGDQGDDDADFVGDDRSQPPSSSGDSSSEDYDDDESDAAMSQTGSDILYRGFIDSLTKPPPEPETAAEEGPKIYENEAKNYDTYMYSPTGEKGLLEHIAGPECRSTSGYNGHYISHEAMRGCNTAQCFMRIPVGGFALPPSDAETFEMPGAFVMTGISDHMPSTDSSDLDVSPARWGISELVPDNGAWHDDHEEAFGMPFHPACLEIFKRASLLRFGCVDVEGLEELWYLESHPNHPNETFGPMPRSDDVRKGREQWWRHHRGSEYLAANPCLVPGWGELLSSAQSRSKPRLQIRRWPEVFGDGDTFSILPFEIKMMIAKSLPFKDIRNLELVSPTFRNMPNSVFYEVTLRDMPWLYEAWTSMPLSWWTTTTEKELRDTDEEWMRRIDPLVTALDNLQDESDMDEAEKDTLEAVLHGVANTVPGPRPKQCKKPVQFLDQQATDWYWLRYQMEKRERDLPGLKNRERIWKDCMEVIDRIEGHREGDNMRPRGEQI